MVSNCWFVISVPCFVTAFIFIVASVIWYDNGNNATAKTCVYVFFLAMTLGTTSIVMGFHALDKMPVKIVQVAPSAEMTEKAVKNYIDNLSMDQKYDIITKSINKGN